MQTWNLPNIQYKKVKDFVNARTNDGSLLAEAVDALDHGMLWVDSELRVVGHNEAYRRLLDIPADAAPVGLTYRQLLDLLSERGEFAGGPEEIQAEERLGLAGRRQTAQTERVRPSGVALSIKACPLSSGGCVFTYVDVTRERAAREIQRRNAKATVVAMANFAEHRDTDTGVHVLRVARLVGQTARKLMTRGSSGEIDEEWIERIATASILHDVGKISTPDHILLKNGPLKYDERDIMQRHTVDGARLLRQAKLTMGESEYLELGVEIALTHHERYDGRGYPNGMAGDAIPIGGRICAVADVFDALTSRRPYKTPWPSERARALIIEQRGAQFDPDVVDAFIKVIEEREQVSIVNWQESYSVGNQHIDEQHQILIDTINQLASAESLNNHHAVLMIIDELASYAAFHFDFEERLMESAGYPDLQRHRAVHLAFGSWVANLREQHFRYGRRPLGVSVLGFLRDWLDHHILGEDQRYRPYIHGMY